MKMKLLCRCQPMVQDDYQQINKASSQPTFQSARRYQKMQKQRTRTTDTMHPLHSIRASAGQRKCCTRGMAKLRQAGRQRSCMCTLTDVVTKALVHLVTTFRRSAEESLSLQKSPTKQPLENTHYFAASSETQPNDNNPGETDDPMNGRIKGSNVSMSYGRKEPFDDLSTITQAAKMKTFM
jgi:hypothetical protein